MQKLVTALCLGGTEIELVENLSLKQLLGVVGALAKNSPKHLWSSDSMIRHNGPKPSLNKQWYLPRVL